MRMEQRFWVIIFFEFMAIAIDNTQYFDLKATTFEQYSELHRDKL